MKNISKNPFIVAEYIRPEYFCNRKQETENLKNSVFNGRNTTLYSLRRVGKSSLIFHLFHILQKTHTCLHIDLYPTENIRDLIKSFADAVFRTMKYKGDTFKALSNIFKYIIPKISFDPVTGNPSLEFGFKESAEALYTLEEIFEYLNRKSENTNIIIAFDEFQQILNYPEKNTEALLRSRIQYLDNVRFIFSGSKKGMLTSMFADNKRPFYASTGLMYLDKIGFNDYSDFIRKTFAKSGIGIDDESVHEILDWCRLHTFYVQFFCNRLYSSGYSEIKNRAISDIKSRILNEFSEFYNSLKNILTPFQFKLIKAIAKENGAGFVTSGDFISRHNLKSASSVQTAVESLLKKEVLYEDKGKYFIYDVFFSRWLETQAVN